MYTETAWTAVQAAEFYSLMSAMRDDLPDGAWAEAREARTDYRKNGKTDWAAFAEDLQQIAADWGLGL